MVSCEGLRILRTFGRHKSIQSAQFLKIKSDEQEGWTAEREPAKASVVGLRLTKMGDAIKKRQSFVALPL